MIKRHLPAVGAMIAGVALIGLVTQDWRVAVATIVPLLIGFALGVYSERKIRRGDIKQQLRHLLDNEDIEYVEKHE